MSEDLLSPNFEEETVPTQETEEGIRPEQLFRSIENIAKKRVDYLHNMDKLMSEHDRVSVGEAGMLEYRQLGAFSEDLVKKQWQLFIETKSAYEQEDLSGEINEDLHRRLRFLARSLTAKHLVCSTMEEYFMKTNEGFREMSVLDRNNLIAEYLFRVFMGDGVQIPSGLQYFESELGITFTLKDLKSLYDLWTTDGGGLEIPSDKKNEAENTIGGYFSVKNFTIEVGEGVEKDYKVGVVFQRSYGNSKGREIIDHYAHLHEKQHLIDFMITQGLHEKRTKHLESRKSNTNADEINQLLSSENKDHLRTEILAFESTDFMDHGTPNPYVELTDSIIYDHAGFLNRSNANSEDAPKKYRNVFQKVYSELVDSLDDDVKLDNSKEEELRNKYNTFVRESINAVSSLALMYDAEFKNKEYSRQMAIAVLDMFPMEDWPRLSKAMRRYSQFETYRKESDAWRAEINEESERKKAQKPITGSARRPFKR